MLPVSWIKQQCVQICTHLPPVVACYLHKALVFITKKQMLAKATYLAVEGVEARSLVLESIPVAHTCQQEEGEEKKVLVSWKVLAVL